MTTPVIECRNLKKYFDTPYGKLHAVDNVSFSLEREKTLGIVGESGCGKSTLGRTILGLHKATSGKVLFEGREIQDLSAQDMKPLRKEMQIIFQDPYSSLNPRDTVAQIISQPLQIQNVYKTRAEIDQRVAELMDIVGLGQRFANTYPHEMDGGRRQRVGIARALAVNPKFVVCDEPVSALDVSIQAQVLNLMMDLQDQMGLTYLFITHNLAVVKHISDDIAVMYLGQMVEKSETDDLFREPLHPYTKALLKAIPIPEIGQRNSIKNVLKGEVTSPIEPRPGCRFAPRCPYASDACRQEEPVLQEVKEGHFVACHLFNSSRQVAETEERKEETTCEK